MLNRIQVQYQDYINFALLLLIHFYIILISFYDLSI